MKETLQIIGRLIRWALRAGEAAFMWTLLLLLMLLLQFSAVAQTTPNVIKDDTNACPITFATTVTSTNFTAGSTNSRIIFIPKNSGLSVFPQVTVYNATGNGAVTSSATNFLFAFSPTYDGTNFASQPSFFCYVPNIIAAGTTGTLTGFTNWSPATLAGVRGIQCVGVTNVGPWKGGVYSGWAVPHIYYAYPQ